MKWKGTEKCQVMSCQVVIPKLSFAVAITWVGIQVGYEGKIRLQLWGFKPDN